MIAKHWRLWGLSAHSGNRRVIRLLNCLQDVFVGTGEQLERAGRRCHHASSRLSPLSTSSSYHVWWRGSSSYSGISISVRPDIVFSLVDRSPSTEIAAPRAQTAQQLSFSFSRMQITMSWITSPPRLLISIVWLPCQAGCVSTAQRIEVGFSACEFRRKAHLSHQSFHQHRSVLVPTIVH